MLIKTVQVNTFKSAIDSVKDILGEVSLIFDPEDGVTMPAVDAGKRAFVHMNLRPDKFETFFVEKPVVATFEISHLYKIVKNVSSHNFNTLSMTVADDVLQVHMENTETSTSITYDLRLVKDPRPELKIPTIDYQTSFLIDAQELARYLRDIQSVANTVKLRIKNRQLVLVAMGALGKCKIRVLASTTEVPSTAKKQRTKGVYFLHNELSDGASLSGRFVVRYMTAFCKAACLGSLMCVKMAQGMPLCCEFRVGNLGVLRFYLCPQT